MLYQLFEKKWQVGDFFRVFSEYFETNGFSIFSRQNRFSKNLFADTILKVIWGVPTNLQQYPTI